MKEAITNQTSTDEWERDNKAQKLYNIAISPEIAEIYWHDAHQQGVGGVQISAFIKSCVNGI